MYERNGRWVSDFWYEGRRYKKSHGPVNKTVAKEKDRLFRAEVASGDYQKKTDNPIFTKVLDEHLKKSAAENQSSSYKRNLLSAGHLKEHFGNRRIKDIETNEILMWKYVNDRKEAIRAKQMKGGRSEEEVSYTTINRELALLSAMFNVLIKAGKANRNPVRLVTRFEEHERETVLTHEERLKILETIENADRRYHHLKDIIIVGLNTAMRIGEILAMGKDWINLKEGVIVVPRHSQKRKKKDKRVPINTTIRPIVERLLKEHPDSPYIFVNPKTGGRFTSVQNAWNGILKKAGLIGKPGVNKLRLHDLRHTCATMLAQSGKDIKFIAQYLGHSDFKTSARYIHHSDEDLRQGAEILAQVPPKSTPAKTEKLEILYPLSSAR